MHLAILVTNTDESGFADRHPKDGEKFSNLIHAVRPDWEISVFQVKDDHQWIDRLKLLVIEAHQAGQPIFGACFGHQMIAQALGAEIGDNPTGWVLGTVQTSSVSKPEWEADLPDKINFYAAHHEQVLNLPDGAELIHQAPTCNIAGFRIGNQIYTTQYHPEMEHQFITALTEELSGELPGDVIAASTQSLASRSHYMEFAESIARFFELKRSV
ncbi:MAG: type 1 glutamine amidotransferase [Rhizobiaceae bacterium]|nr:type 1 glutamine amidotransferase [Rhizobiaceae bacterium]